MTDCQFVYDPPDQSARCVCAHCGYVSLGKSPPEKRHRLCTTPPDPRMLPVPSPPPPIDIPSLLARFLPGRLCVTPDQYADRLAICNDCPARIDAHSPNRCPICTCYLPLKAKLRAFHCPQLLWPGDPPWKPDA